MWRSIVPVTYTVHDTSSCSATVCPILLCCHASMSPCPSCFVWFWIKKCYGSCHVHKMHPVPKYVLKPRRFGQVFCYSEDLYGNLQYSLTSPLTVHTTDSWVQGFHMSCERPKQKEEIDDMVMIPLRVLADGVTKSAEMQVGERIWVIMTSGLGNPGIYGLTNPRKEDTFGLRNQPTTCRWKKKLLILGRLVISSASDFSTGWFCHPNMTIIDIFQVGGKESTERPEISPAFAVSSGYHCAQVAYQPHLSQRPLHHRWSRPGTQENFHLVSKGPHLPIFICSMCMKVYHDIYHDIYHEIYHVVTSCCHIMLSIFVHDMLPPRPGRSGWCLSSLGAMYGDHQGWTTWSIGKIYRWTMVNNGEQPPLKVSIMGIMFINIVV